MPRLTARRIRANERARSPGSLAAARAAMFAGRKISPTKLRIRITRKIASRPWMWPSVRNPTPVSTRLAFITRWGSTRSQSQPPMYEAATPPSPYTARA